MSQGFRVTPERDHRSRPSDMPGRGLGSGYGRGHPDWEMPQGTPAAPTETSDDAGGVAGRRATSNGAVFRSLLLSLVINAALPFLTYTFLTRQGMATVPALGAPERGRCRPSGRRSPRHTGLEHVAGTEVRHRHRRHPAGIIMPRCSRTRARAVLTP